MKPAHIEDIYPATPSQAGILFESTAAPAKGYYVTQLVCRIRELDVVAFERAWDGVVARQPALRTAFAWEEVLSPLQVVGTQARLEWTTDDLSAHGAAEIAARVERYLDDDRTRGFVLTRAPLIRAARYTLPGGEHQFIWTHHHVALDGWSVPIVLDELRRLYDIERGGHETMPSVVPPRRYAEWLAACRADAAEAYWRREFHDIGAGPVSAFTTAPTGAAVASATRLLVVPLERTEALRAMAARLNITLNTLVQGAWMLALRRLYDRDELVAGVTCAGRPPEIDGVERMVGMFVNVLPLRVRFPRDQRVDEWLQAAQSRQAEMRAFEHTAHPQVVRWAGLPSGTRLFQTIFTWQNYPLVTAAVDESQTLAAVDVRHVTRNHYPLTLVGAARSQMLLQARYDPAQLDSELVARLFERFEQALQVLDERADATIDDLLRQLTASEESKVAARRQEAAAGTRRRLRETRPQTVRVESDRLVRTGLLNGKPLPLMLTPTAALDVVDWAAANRDALDAHLLTHGAVLLRGFTVDSVARFEALAAAICPNLFEEYGDLPRAEVGGKVYASTPYPSHHPILFHNESSHLHSWPMRIWFHCVTAAESGGETPIVDCADVYARLGPGVRETFAERGLLYVRNFTPALDVSWQQFFATGDRGDVEARCAAEGVACEWLDGDRLRTTRRAAAVLHHPRTGAPLFFNQLQLHHPSFLPAELREHVDALFAPEDLPRNVLYGDGRPIEADVLQEVLSVSWEASVAFPWSAGDVLMLDNMRVAHARNPFTGARRIVVAMADLVSAERFAPAAMAHLSNSVR